MAGAPRPRTPAYDPPNSRSALRAEDLCAQRVVVLLSEQGTPEGRAIGLDATAMRAAEGCGRAHARILAAGEAECRRLVSALSGAGAPSWRRSTLHPGMHDAGTSLVDVAQVVAAGFAVVAAVGIPMTAYWRRPKLRLHEDVEGVYSGIGVDVNDGSQIPFVRLLVTNAKRRRAAYRARVPS
jgi:hypothetical protein